MSVKEFLDDLALRNSLNRARWAWRWARQGGTYFTTARPLQDLRSEEDLERWRKTEFKLRHTPKSKRKIINLAAVRIARAARKRVPA